MCHTSTKKSAPVLSLAFAGNQQSQLVLHEDQDMEVSKLTVESYPVTTCTSTSRCAKNIGSKSRKISIDIKVKRNSHRCAPSVVDHGRFESIIVHHSYHDHAKDELLVRNNADNNCDDVQHGSSSKIHSQTGGVLTPFTLKLYETLSAVERDGYHDIISWQPHGRCFVVHCPDRFKKEILPQYFHLTKIASFQRQLNLYGFKRLTTGKDRSGYYHEMFLRGRMDLLPCINRVKVKGTNIRAKSNPNDEPDFWNDYPWMTEDDDTEIKKTVTTVDNSFLLNHHANIITPVTHVSGKEVVNVFPDSEITSMWNSDLLSSMLSNTLPSSRSMMTINSMKHITDEEFTRWYPIPEIHSHSLMDVSLLDDEQDDDPEPIPTTSTVGYNYLDNKDFFDCLTNSLLDDVEQFDDYDLELLTNLIFD